MEEAFKQVYHTYFEPLCRFADFYSSDKSVAKDVVQQVFLKLWESGKDVREISNIKSYLFTSVKNQVLNDQRKNRVMEELESEEVAADFNISDTLDGQELQEKIERLIESLPEKRRYIFRLSREEQQSYKEIAELLDISPRTVENQISKALKYLKEQIFGSDNQ